MNHATDSTRRSLILSSCAFFSLQITIAVAAVGTGVGFLITGATGHPISLSILLFGVVTLAKLGAEEIWLSVTNNEPEQAKRGEALIESEHKAFLDHATMVLTTSGVLLGLVSVFGHEHGDNETAQQIAAVALLMALVVGLFLHNILSSTFFPTQSRSRFFLGYLFVALYWPFTLGLVMLAGSVAF